MNIFIENTELIRSIKSIIDVIFFFIRRKLEEAVQKYANPNAEYSKKVDHNKII